MVPAHPSTARWVPSTPHRSRPAGHPTNRQPCAVAGIRRRARCRSRRRTKTTPERSTPPSERGTTTSTHTPTETSRDRGTPPPPPAPPSHPRRRRDAVTTRQKTTRSAPERSTPPAGVQGNYVNPHTDDDEPRPRDAHADPCPAATAPPFPPPRRPRRAAREARFPVGSARPLHRRAAAKMSPRIRTGPEAVLAAHAPPPSAAAATARRKPDQIPITGTEFFLLMKAEADAEKTRMQAKTSYAEELRKFLHSIQVLENRAVTNNEQQELFKRALSQAYTKYSEFLTQHEAR